MKRKRFKHQVYIFCHMFSGWQLYADVEKLNHLKSGQLRIDIKEGLCKFNGSSITGLAMPLVLQDWLQEDCAQNSISIHEIDIAQLTVDFEMNPQGGASSFICKSSIHSGENVYALEYEGEKGKNLVIET